MQVAKMKSEIKKLPLDEQITFAHDILDSIAANDNCSVYLTDEQKRELDKQYKEYKEGKLKLHDWEDIKSELRAQCK